MIQARRLLFCVDIKESANSTNALRYDRAAAVDMAIAAAEKILRDKAAGPGGAALIDESIRSIKTRLN